MDWDKIKAWASTQKSGLVVGAIAALIVRAIIR